MNNHIFNNNLFQQTPQKQQEFNNPSQSTGFGAGQSSLGGNLTGPPNHLTGQPNHLTSNLNGSPSLIGQPLAGSSTLMGQSSLAGPSNLTSNLMGQPLAGSSFPGAGNPSFQGTGNPFSSNPLNKPSNPMGINNPIGNFASQDTFGNISKPSPFSSNFSSYNQGSNQGASSNQFGQGVASNFGGVSSSNFGGTSSGGFGGNSNWFPLSSQSNKTWGMNNKGSKVAPYKTTKIREDAIMIDLVDITAMKEYDKNIDEIRIEDYELGRKPDTGSINRNENSLNFNQGSTGGLLQGNTSGLLQGNTNFNTFNSTGIQDASGASRLGTATPFSSNVANTFGTGATAPSNPFSSTGYNSINSTGGYSPINSTFGQQQSSVNNLMTPKPGMSTTLGGGTTNPNIFSRPLSTQSNSFQMPGTGVQPGVNLFGGDKAATNPSFLGASQPGATAAFSDSTLFNNKPALTTGMLGMTQPGMAQPQPGMFGMTQTQPSAMFGMNQNNQFGGAVQSNPSGSSFNAAPCNYQNQNASYCNYQNNAPYNYTVSNDPYMAENLKIDTVEPQRPSFVVKLPRPIFNTEKGAVSLDFMIRGSKETAAPQVRTVPGLIEANVPIHNLTVYVEGKGKIEYKEPVILSSVDDVSTKIRFLGEDVEVSDPAGTGLNKAARVSAENVCPSLMRMTKEGADDGVDEFVKRNLMDRFIFRLKNDKHKRYVDYDANTKVYVYEVAHF